MTEGSRQKAVGRAKSKGKTQMSKVKSANIAGYAFWGLIFVSAYCPLPTAYRPLPFPPPTGGYYFLCYIQNRGNPTGKAGSGMTTEAELREKLRKIYALFEGATTPGERDAAAAAINRVKAALAAEQKREQPVEMRFSLPDRWQRRLFTALCRRYGLEPYRYRGQRYSSLMVRIPRSFVDGVLWPEFREIKKVLDEYLNEATERIIREEVFQNAREPQERAG